MSNQQVGTIQLLLSPIGECPIDPEETDEDLNAEKEHNEWMEYWKWKENTNWW
jgi:hypothetical protein